MMTLAPRLAKFLAISKPVPEVAPITIATLPSKRASVSHSENSSRVLSIGNVYAFARLRYNTESDKVRQ